MFRQLCLSLLVFCFFFNDPATTEIYTLSLHDALPISYDFAKQRCDRQRPGGAGPEEVFVRYLGAGGLYLEWRGTPILVGDRKSTRLNSSHSQISYAVFCLKKKKNKNKLSKVLLSRCVL